MKNLALPLSLTLLLSACPPVSQVEPSSSLPTTSLQTPVPSPPPSETSPNASPSPSGNAVSPSNPTTTPANTESSTQPPTNTPTGVQNSSVAVASISFAEDTNRFLTQKGQERQFNVVLLDETGNKISPENLALDWSSSRPRDITVDNQGKVKAIVGLGYSELTVSVPGTQVRAKLMLDVTDPSFFSSTRKATSPTPSSKPTPMPTGFKINGEAADNFSGYSVSGAGDVNGDGKDDIIIGAYLAAPNGNIDSGSSYVIFGGSVTGSELNLAALTATQGFKINGEAADNFSGYSVSGAGDVNGDGKDDIIIGAYLATPNGNISSGSSYVIFGGSVTGSELNLAALTATQGFKINGETAGDAAGYSVSGAGDVNGDGKDDIIIGAYAADPNGNISSGSSYVIFGGSVTGTELNLTALTATQGFKINGEAVSDFSGYSVSGAGDVNGDGKDDIIIGAYKADPNGNVTSGSSYVIFGGSVTGTELNLTALTATQGFKINGEAVGDESGYSVSGAGDVNGDDKDDIIIGAHKADPNGNISSGSSYVIFGGSVTGTELNLAALTATQGFKINGETAYNRSGISVSGAGDVNGDGKDDIIIGAYLAAPNGNISSGSSYVIFGGSVTGSVLELSSIQ